MKTIVYALAVVFFSAKTASARQDTEGQLTDFAVELGFFIQGGLCAPSGPLPEDVRSRWAGYYNELLALSGAPRAKAAYSAFFASTLGFDEETHFYFFGYLNEFLDDFGSWSDRERAQLVVPADGWSTEHMSKEHMRWLILLGATLSPMSDSDARLVRYGQFPVDFPEPERGLASLKGEPAKEATPLCSREDITEALGEADPLYVGSSAMFSMWNIFLAP